MDQEKFGKFIKEIRQNNNLTQKQLADKYNVTYQAVSKWENGKNMPDISLIKQISEDFNISLEELFDGEFKETKKEKIDYKKIIVLTTLVVFVIFSIFIIKDIIEKNDFEFKTLSSQCENFTIQGNIAYNEKKSAIYITNIEYCGEPDNQIYKNIECSLYESHEDTDKKISSYTNDKETTLDAFLENLTFTVDGYDKSCTCDKECENSLYLLIHAINSENKTRTYKIPLSLNACKETNK